MSCPPAWNIVLRISSNGDYCLCAADVFISETLKSLGLLRVVSTYFALQRLVVTVKVKRNSPGSSSILIHIRPHPYRHQVRHSHRHQRCHRHCHRYWHPYYRCNTIAIRAFFPPLHKTAITHSFKQ